MGWVRSARVPIHAAQPSFARDGGHKLALRVGAKAGAQQAISGSISRASIARGVQNI
jgi:hypothetical protein